MKLKKFLTMTALCLAFASVGAQANDKKTDVITKQLAQFDIEVKEVQPSPIAGMFEVVTQSGILYTNQDASYFVYGKLFSTKNGELVDLTAKAQAKQNLALFNAAKVEDELIVYPAKNEKHVINVFTDTTCGYCVKLHSQIKQYNDLGITVRYLAFPRGGEQSSNLNQMSAIWCAEDKNKAMNLAKGKGFKEGNTTCMKTIHKHYTLGAQIGITGTPAIMLQDGSLVSGYVPPAQLLQRLNAAKS